MEQNIQKSDNLNRSNTDTSIDKTTSSSKENVSDYISGDSTPSSSSHQFPWIATDPKNQTKKSAQKTNK